MKSLFFKYFLILSTLFLLFGCKALVSKQSLPVELQRQWMLTSIVGYTKEQLMKNKAQLDLKLHSGNIANLGCGNFSVQVSGIVDDKIKFKTKDNPFKNCIKTEAIEYVFRNEMAKVNRYEIEGHFLKLYHNDQLLLKFVASDWD